MAVRRQMIQADQMIERVIDGEVVGIPVVSREALVEAAVDAVVYSSLAGGIVTIVVGRTRTGVPGEMVTHEAVVEWKDRTDAKAQPEQPVDLTPRAQEPDAQEDPLAAALRALPDETRRQIFDLAQAAHDNERTPDGGFVAPPTVNGAPVVVAPSGESPDGLNVAELPDEDTSAIDRQMARA